MASETIYDHPNYYDILFGWDRGREADFYQELFRREGLPPRAPVLEVACGPARIARVLASREPDWRLVGLDSSASMLALARARAEESGLALDFLCSPMEAFRYPTPLAAAYNPLSSFRLLQSDAAAEAHLQAMAAALRPGALYVLDFALQGSVDDEVLTTDESWEMSEGAITVRADNDAVTVEDGGVEHVLAWGPEVHLRGYTREALADCVARTGRFEIEAWYVEHGCDEAGVSVFGTDPVPAPDEGRVMVALRRTSSAP
jgi:SAM-dependent methyltransferase